MMEPGPGVDVATLSKLSLGELREMWRKQFKSPVPAYQSRVLLLHALAHALQSRRHGRLKASTRRQLLDLGREFAADPRYRPKQPQELQPGTLLLRDWNRRRYGVTVTTDGFLFEGVTYRSLSKVAEVITGVKRSGPLFFRATADEDNPAS